MVARQFGGPDQLIISNGDRPNFVIRVVKQENASSAIHILVLTNPYSFKLLGCYMVKPHEQLVHVSFMHRCTSTPCLSTSWS